MSRRLEAIARIQELSTEEGTRQPSAADWLKDQDRKRRELTRPALEGRMRLIAVLSKFPFAAY